MTDIEEKQTPDIDNMSDEEFEAFKGGMEESPPEESPKAEAQEEQKAEEQRKQEEFVPHGQFHRERERRKEAEQRAELAMRRMTELMEAMQPQPQQQTQHQVPQIPGEDDIVGRINWSVEQLRQMQENQQRYSQMTEAQQREEQAFQQVLSEKGREFAEAAQERPDVQDAYAYARQSLFNEFQFYGFTPQQAMQELEQYERKLIMDAHQRGMNVGDYVEKYAAARGWRPNQQQTRQQAQPRDESGRFTPAQEIDRREAIRQASISIGGSGSAAPSGQVSPKDLVDMSEEDFAAFKAKYGERAMQVAFGG